ncbi:MAG TPA: hypothetical protein ENI61_06255 [Ignavibacteria bacterium]|nr:hypothetical protein [Ignavibacteria bacterium]
MNNPFLNNKQKAKSLTHRDTQTGKSDLKRDKSRKAMPSGKRMSKNGKIYYEGRKNRSDIKNNI